MKTRTLDLATRIAEREWQHHQKAPNTPMPVIADVRAELQRLERQVRKLYTTEMNSEHSWAKGYSTALNDVLALIRKAEQ